VHDSRVKADLAHAKDQKTGRPTRALSFKAREVLVKSRKIAWAELIIQVKKLQ
jgi:hypothetical protein